MFSSLFLGTQIPKVAVIWKQAGPQLMYGMLIAWGQWIVALVVTGALLVRTAYRPAGRHQCRVALGTQIVEQRINSEV